MIGRMVKIVGLLFQLLFWAGLARLLVVFERTRTWLNGGPT